MNTRTYMNMIGEWLDTHELADEVGVHVNVTPASGRVSLFAPSAEVMRDTRRVVGPMRKVEGGGGFTLEATIDGITFAIFPPIGTCKRVKVGERVEQVAKEVRPAETVTVEETVDVYEWDCGGVLVEDDAEVPA